MYLYCVTYLLLIDDDSELDSSGAEAVGGFRVEWQNLSWCSCQNECSATCLWHSILSSLQHTKGTLVAHLDQAAQSELEHHTALEGDKVANILQQEEAWSVVVTVAEVGDNKGVLEL